MALWRPRSPRAFVYLALCHGGRVNTGEEISNAIYIVGGMLYVNKAKFRSFFAFKISFFGGGNLLPLLYFMFKGSGPVNTFSTCMSKDVQAL